MYLKTKIYTVLSFYFVAVRDVLRTLSNPWPRRQILNFSRILWQVPFTRIGWSTSEKKIHLLQRSLATKTLKVFHPFCTVSIHKNILRETLTSFPSILRIVNYEDSGKIMSGQGNNIETSNFQKFLRKAPVPESLFDKVAGLKAGNFIKKNLQRKCFSEKL